MKKKDKFLKIMHYLHRVSARYGIGSNMIMAIAAIATAFATIVLALVTGRYVELTRDLINKQYIQIDQQREQFELVNRAKILINGFPVGDMNRSNLTLVNTGNLPAEDVKMVWKLIKVDGDRVVRMFPEPSLSGIISNDKAEIKTFAVIDPEEAKTLLCTSDFEKNEEFIFLIVCWRYKGKGVKEYRFKDHMFLWVTSVSAWAETSIVGADNLKAVNSVKVELEKVL